jgi:hypothetical protein
MLAPPDPQNARRAASAKAAPEIAQSEQERRYTIPADAQVFIEGLLSLWLTMISIVASLTWGAR